MGIDMKVYLIWRNNFDSHDDLCEAALSKETAYKYILEQEERGDKRSYYVETVETIDKGKKGSKKGSSPSRGNEIYYAIYLDTDEYGNNCVYAYITKSFIDAKLHIMDYAEWYSPKGTCRIRKINKKFRVLEEHRYWMGEERTK